MKYGSEQQPPPFRDRREARVREGGTVNDTLAVEYRPSIPATAWMPSGIYCKDCPHYSRFEVMPGECRRCMLAYARKMNRVARASDGNHTDHIN